MGLSGLDIYKKLPQDNCGDCGPPTCLAFAMQLAEGKASLDECPHVTDEAKAELDAAAAPPINLVEIGSEDTTQVELGNETELFRHDKRFFNKTGIAVKVSDQLEEEALKERLERVNDLQITRVGLVHDVRMLAVVNDSGAADQYLETLKKVVAGSDLALILVCEDPEVAAEALELVADRNPLLYGATVDNYQQLAALAEEHEVTLGVKGENLEELAELSQKVMDEGCKDLIIDSGARNTSQVLADQTQIRRQAVEKKFRPFGHPTITFTSKEDPASEMVQAGVYVAKYAGIVVIDQDLPKYVLPMLTVRQDIYTDPQKPVTVEPKLHEVGEVHEESPVIITTNFSLTYYSVEGDVGSVPSYILPVDTDGTSVLTAWAADKFSPKKIAEFMEETGVADKVSHKKVIIPGLVAVISGKLELESGWEVIVGPRESAGLRSFLKKEWSA